MLPPKVAGYVSVWMCDLVAVTLLCKLISFVICYSKRWCHPHVWMHGAATCYIIHTPQTASIEEQDWKDKKWVEKEVRFTNVLSTRNWWALRHRRRQTPCVYWSLFCVKWHHGHSLDIMLLHVNRKSDFVFLCEFTWTFLPDFLPMSFQTMKPWSVFEKRSPHNSKKIATRCVVAWDQFMI